MENDISHIDKNLAVCQQFSVTDCIFHDVTDAPFRLYGLCGHEKGSAFRRVPEVIAQASGEKISRLSTRTAGGRVRFTTNSEYIAIQCEMPSVTHFSHMSLLGTSGFDMYVTQNGISTFAKSFVPPYNMTDGYASIHHFGTRALREITIYFPSYNNVDALYIGLEATAEIGSHREYTHQKPLVFYGSSITQGACASRSGNAYPALISQRLDWDYINLGFSGTPMGADAMVNYISGLSMGAFIYDFDYKAQSIEYLENTHASVFRRIRQAQPELPVIIVSAADAPVLTDIEAYRQVAYRTYLQALSEGDKYVQFIDGSLLYAGAEDVCRVDLVHPSDLGVFRTAEAIIDRLSIQKTAEKECFL